MFAASLWESTTVLFQREVVTIRSACKKKGYPPNPKLRGARMFAVIFLIVIALVLSYTAYLIWYAKSGRYDFDQRFDSVTKR